MDTETRLARLESQVRRWKNLSIGLLFLMAVGATAAITTQSAATAAPEAPPRLAQNNAVVGRYQVEVVPRELNPQLVIIDTWTGRTWTAQNIGGPLSDRGLPPGIEKE